MKKLTYEFIKSEFDKRGYELLETEYIGNKTKMAYICIKHGHQFITWNHLSKGCGCYHCGRESIADKRRLSIDTVRDKFTECGYTLLSTEYIKSSIPLRYLCHSHGEQTIRYNDLQQGDRCPQCSTSKGERAIQEYLDSHDITYATEYTFKDLEYKAKLRFDFCIFGNDGKTIVQLIEYQGIQHYKPVDFAGKGKEWAEEQFESNKIKDQLKVDYCKLHKIPLLTIKYSEFSYLEELLDKEVRKHR